METQTIGMTDIPKPQNLPLIGKFPPNPLGSKTGKRSKESSLNSLPRSPKS